MPLWDLLPARPVNRREIAAVLEPAFAETIGRKIYAKVPLSGYREKDYRGIAFGDPDPEDPKERIHEFARPETEDEPYSVFGVFDKRVHLVALYTDHERDIARTTLSVGTDRSVEDVSYSSDAYELVGWRRVDTFPRDDVPGTWVDLAYANKGRRYVFPPPNGERYENTVVEDDEAEELREQFRREIAEAEPERDAATLFAVPEGKVERYDPGSTHLVEASEGKRPAPMADALCGTTVATGPSTHVRLPEGWPSVPECLEHPQVCDACVRVVEDDRTPWVYGDVQFDDREGTPGEDYPRPSDEAQFRRQVGTEDEAVTVDDTVFVALAAALTGHDGGEVPSFRAEVGEQTLTECYVENVTVTKGLNDPGPPEVEVEAVGLDAFDDEVSLSFTLSRDEARELLEQVARPDP